MHLREEPGSLSAEKIPKGISLSETPIKLQQHSSSPIYFPHRATQIFSLKLPLPLSTSPQNTYHQLWNMDQTRDVWPETTQDWQEETHETEHDCSAQ